MDSPFQTAIPEISPAPATRIAFCASTGRTATMHVAKCLDRLPGVVGLHQGHLVGDAPKPRLPLINVHNRRAWHDPKYAERLVAEKRGLTALDNAADGAPMLVDVAFYNAPLLAAIRRRYPDALLFVLFRRCEGFIRSATIVSGEDRLPVGWPDPSKPLTDREKFISLGRLKPEPNTPDHASWTNWSAIQRNVWLWATVNGHLHRFARNHTTCRRLFFEDLVDRPNAFWTALLSALDRLTPQTLAHCVEFSKSKSNGRAAYQICPQGSWCAAERAFYAERARPLEEEIYG
ncbi:MAG: hypothetical protein OXI66_12570 [Boseongicola sp.]|nr:hypothetical protein [Boseongicola sp.]